MRWLSTLKAWFWLSNLKTETRPSTLKARSHPATLTTKSSFWKLKMRRVPKTQIYHWHWWQNYNKIFKIRFTPNLTGESFDSDPQPWQLEPNLQTTWLWNLNWVYVCLVCVVVRQRLTCSRHRNTTYTRHFQHEYFASPVEFAKRTQQGYLKKNKFNKKSFSSKKKWIDLGWLGWGHRVKGRLVPHPARAVGTWRPKIRQSPKP